jgi:hypothetical protein
MTRAVRTEYGPDVERHFVPAGFRIVSKIGSGTYGHIYRLQHHDGRSLCLKLEHIQLPTLTHSDGRPYTQREIVASSNNQYRQNYYEVVVQHRMAAHGLAPTVYKFALLFNQQLPRDALDGRLQEPIAAVLMERIDTVFSSMLKSMYFAPDGYRDGDVIPRLRNRSIVSRSSGRRIIRTIMDQAMDKADHMRTQAHTTHGDMHPGNIGIRLSYVGGRARYQVLFIDFARSWTYPSPPGMPSQTRIRDIIGGYALQHVVVLPPGNDEGYYRYYLKSVTSRLLGRNAIRLPPDDMARTQDEEKGPFRQAVFAVVPDARNIDRRMRQMEAAGELNDIRPVQQIVAIPTNVELEDAMNPHDDDDDEDGEVSGSDSDSDYEPTEREVRHAIEDGDESDDGGYDSD